MIPLAAFFLGAAMVAACLDLFFGRAPAPQAEVLGPDDAALTVMRLIEGRPQTLRLGIAVPRHQTGVRMALLPATADFARGLELPAGVWRLRPSSANRDRWSGQITGRARGRFRGLRCGWETGSRLGFWRVRQWHTLPCDFIIYPDLTPGRRALFRSPVFRALSASTVLPLTGQGREFERLREYQPGDLYADLSWKATARRAFPVTRLFQWERQQEIYFVVDHGRLSALPGADGRLMLERYIETALIGACAAAEIGDHFGLIAFADDVTHWLPAGSGRRHFSACRERLLDLEPSPATPAYDRVFVAIRARVRRRCYLLFLTDLTERGLAQSFRQAASLACQTHVVLAASVLPAVARPLWQPDQPAVFSVEAIYAALAGDQELRRIAGLGPQLARSAIQFRAIPETEFLATAVGGYLEAKREQRL